MLEVSHLYNLRTSTGYTRRRHHFTKTKSRQLPIGTRRKPTPKGKPGYLRKVALIYRPSTRSTKASLAGRKGVYYLNAVDEVTQFQAVVCVSILSEAFLIPAACRTVRRFSVRDQRLSFRWPIN